MDDLIDLECDILSSCSSSYTSASSSSYSDIDLPYMNACNEEQDSINISNYTHISGSSSSHMATPNTEIRIKDNSRMTNFFEELHSWWQSGSEQLCDVTLKVAKKSFRVHKIVLISSSQYFKNMFTKENPKKCVELHHVDPNGFRVILEYFYSGYLVLSEDTVERVLTTADYFSLEPVKSICSQYLLKNIDINNCIARYCMGVTFGRHDLERQTKSFIVEKLDEVSKTSHFQKIDKDTLTKLLTTTNPNADGGQMYTAVVDWVKYDFDNRQLFISDLVKLIPIRNISHNFYMNSMQNDTILRQNLKCTNWLLDIADKFAEFNLGASFEAKLFITSRFSEKSNCFQLQLKNDELNPLPARPDITYFSAVSYKKSIYLTAGDYDETDLEKSYKYDIHKNSWSEINLNFERCCAAVCILQDQLFVVGGYNNLKGCSLNSCISYDFNSNQKLVLPDMKEMTCVPGISAYHNSIYVCCGEKESENLSCIERCDPREGLWQNVGKYKFVSRQCCSTVISDYLYTSTLYDAVVERFDLRNNSTEKLAEPIRTNRNWITSSQTKLLRVHETGISEYDANNNQWLNKEYSFNIFSPIIVPWDST